MSGSGARRLSPARSLAFAGLVLVAALAGLEGAARSTEDRLPSPRVDPSSRLYFQQLPREPPVESTEDLATFHGIEIDVGDFDPDAPGAEHLTINPGWTDLQGQWIRLPKSASEFRIIVVGGSAIGGWGMPRTATAVGIAERLLARQVPGRTVRIFNLGRTGLGSPQLSVVLEHLVPRIQPDLVVTVMGNNERLDVAAGVHAARDDPSQVALLTSELALLGPLADLSPRARWLVARSALARRLWRESLPEPKPPGSSWGRPAPDEEEEDTSALDAGEELMPPLSKTEWAAEIDAFALSRFHLTLAAIRETVAASGAELLVATVPVNHRYRHPEHEWHFFGMQLFRLESYRTAHWAYYYEAPQLGVQAMEERLRDAAREPVPSPDSGGDGNALGDRAAEFPAHLLLGHFLQQLGRADEAAAHLDQVIAPLRAKLETSTADPGSPWQGDDELLLAWAVRLRNGPEAAQQLVGPLLAQPHWSGTADGASTVCHAVDLRWYAGDVDGARVAAKNCLRESYYYRADGATNEALLQWAGEAGVPSFDLAEAVVDHSPGRIPGYDLFLDYCHYNPRGNLLLGHLLARGIADALGWTHALPAAADALLDHRRRRAGRLTDLPDLDSWAGVNFDVTLLTAERYGEQAHSRREGDAGSALAAVFEGNELAAERYLCFGQCGCHCSASFGPRRSMFPEASARRKAAGAYRRALELEPGMAAAQANLRAVAAAP